MTESEWEKKIETGFHSNCHETTVLAYSEHFLVRKGPQDNILSFGDLAKASGSQDAVRNEFYWREEYCMQMWVELSSPLEKPCGGKFLTFGDILANVELFRFLSCLSLSASDEEIWKN